ncbi:MAG: HEAT repeat domain-containing protein [Bacteroidales bacterium]|nr:HEAT repeat domain-containing protein [Bacteroidales bacterium]
MTEFKKNRTNVSSEDIKELINKLTDNNGMVRQQARETLVSMDNKVTQDIINILQTSNYRLKWEAVKTLEQIADPDSIPAFIELLDDETSEIRWMAAKGLIKTGSLSVKPILNKLLDKADIIFIQGAHHVLNKIDDKEIKILLKPLINALSNKDFVAERISLEAKKTLRLFK